MERVECNKQKLLLMANALSRFIKNRNISPEVLQRTNVLKVRNGRIFHLGYLRLVLKNENAGISLLNIEQLDNLYKLTEEERKDLKTMVKKAQGDRAVKKQSPEESEARKKEKQISRTLRDHQYTISQCKNVREMIAELRQKATEFKLLLCVDWKQHARVNQLSDQQMLQAFIEAHRKNRTEAAKIQLTILGILGQFMSLAEEGLKNEIEVFGSIPSIFMTFDIDVIRKQTQKVVRHGEEKLFSLMNKDASVAQQHYMQWIDTESKNNNGLVDITKYQPATDILRINAWLECLAFEDLAYCKTSMAFFGGGSMTKEILVFYGIEEVINVIEKSANKKITELTSVNEASFK